MKSLDQINQILPPFLLIGILIVGNLISCDPITSESKLGLTKIPVPDYAFSLKDEVIAFEATGKKGTTFDQKIDVSILNQYVAQLEGLLVYEIAPKGDVQYLSHSLKNGFLQARFTAGNQYLIYAVSPDPRINNTYQALCAFRDASLSAKLGPVLLDKLCLVILCSPNLLQTADIIQAIPELAPIANELSFPPEFEFGGIGASSRLLPTAANRGLTDICDRCFGFNPDLIIPADQCLPRKPLPPPSSPPNVSVVNMVPVEDSGEKAQNSEPFLAVNLSAPSYLVGSARAWHATGASASNPAPIFVSEDSGQTWIHNKIIPSTRERPVLGMTIANSTEEGELFVGVHGFGLETGDHFNKFLRTDDYNSSTIMEETFAPQFGEKPYIQASPNPDQRVYIGIVQDIDRQSLPVIYVSENAGNSFTQHILNFRGNRAVRFERYTPTVRPAISEDGTVYVAYLVESADKVSLIVLRDDEGGLGETPFQDLIDPSDGIAGKIVIDDLPKLSRNQIIGRIEETSYRLSLAVHPNNSQIVYLAWEEPVMLRHTNGLHIKRSLDGGKTWSENLRFVPNAINPSLAVTQTGTLGFSYQAVRGRRWITRLEQTNNAFDSRTSTSLASVPVDIPAPGWYPTLGEFMHLIAVGGEFWGVFSATNTPNERNFPNGVSYQRIADFRTRQLSDASGNPVEASIDPFFFRVTSIP